MHAYAGIYLAVPEASRLSVIFHTKQEKNLSVCYVSQSNATICSPGDLHRAQRSVALARPGAVYDELWSNTGAALATNGRRQW